ncbi:MAG: hypothetical protein AAB865_00345 [Patescibacteria group bacterium]
MAALIVIFGSVLNFCGSLLYLRDTLRGTTKPNRVTFLMWTVSPMITGAASLSDGVTWPVVPVFMTGFVTLLIFFASFFNKNAYWKLGRFDYICGALSVLALILWALTKEPAVAVALAILSDFFATTPTLIKAWKHPETETGIAYAASFVSGITALVVIQSWSFTAWAFPANMLIVNGLIFIAIYRKRLRR